jgi:hypothetical protein
MTTSLERSISVESSISPAQPSPTPEVDEIRN